MARVSARSSALSRWRHEVGPIASAFPSISPVSAPAFAPSCSPPGSPAVASWQSAALTPFTPVFAGKTELATSHWPLTTRPPPNPHVRKHWLAQRRRTQRKTFYSFPLSWRTLSCNAPLKCRMSLNTNNLRMESPFPSPRSLRLCARNGGGRKIYSLFC